MENKKYSDSAIQVNAMNDEYSDSVIQVNDEYENTIRDIATKHYKGLLDGITLNSQERKQIVEYAIMNKNHIDDMLANIGYRYTTCTNYSAFSEVLSLIRGEPYFEYIANEIDDRKIIHVYYHPSLLVGTEFHIRQFIHGDHFDAKFNAVTGNFELLNSNKYTLVNTSTITTRGYIKRYYEAVSKK